MADGVVKSAGRVLALLEYLGNVRTAVSMSEVATALAIPQSSASVLLKSLLTMGYLAYDAKDRRYRATYRVALLGEWLQQTMLENNRLGDLVQAISEDTGDTVIVAQQVRAMVQYVHITPSSYPVRLHIPVGTLRPLSSTATGTMLMTRMGEAEVRAIVRRNNAERPDGTSRVDEHDFVNVVSRARRDGFAITRGSMTHGAAVVAMMLPVHDNDVPMAIGVGGTIERITARQDMILEALRRHL